MANNSIPNETKVRHSNPRHFVKDPGPGKTTVGMVVAQSRRGEEYVIVEWNTISGVIDVEIEHVDDLIEIK